MGFSCPAVPAVLLRGLNWASVASPRASHLILFSHRWPGARETALARPDPIRHLGRSPAAPLGPQLVPAVYKQHPQPWRGRRQVFDPPGTESASRTFSSRQTLPPCESRGPGRGRAGPKPPASAPPPPPFALPPPPPPATAAGGGTRAALPASLLGFHIPLADAPTPLCSSSPVQAGHLLLPRRPQGVHQPRAHKVPHRMPCLACLPHSCSISSVLSLHALLAPGTAAAVVAQLRAAS
jgi:hypothetical protein